MDDVRVMIVEDHGMVRDGLISAIDAADRLTIVGDAPDLTNAIAVADRCDPDVVVCDYHLPDGRGSDLPARLGQSRARVLLVSGVDAQIAVRSAVAGGCAGFVAKAEGIDELITAIQHVAEDRAVFPAGLLSDVALTEAAGPELTPREREILGLLATAASSQEMAETLHLSLNTVRNHVRSTMTKLGATTRLEAVVVAARHGLVDLSPAG